MLSNRFRRALDSPYLRTTAIVSVLLLLTAWAALALAGSKMGAVLAIGAAIGPLAFVAALRAPLVFPMALYVLLIPFDNLLTLSSFGTLTKLLGLCCAAAMVLRLLLTRRALSPDPAVLAWLPYIVLAIASFLWADDQTAGVSTLISFVSLFALYALVGVFPVDRRSLYVFIWSVVIGGAIAGAYGAWLFHSGAGANAAAGGRLVIMTDNRKIDPNHFAASLLLPFVLAVTMIVESRRALVRVTAFSALVAIAIGMFLSGSRGGIVSLVIMIGYLVWRSRHRAVLAFVSLSILAPSVAAFGTLLSRFNQIEATAGSGRLGIWHVAAVAFIHRPILGAGFGNFSQAYNAAFLSVAAFAKMKIVEDAHWNIAPHNNLIWVAVELGIAGVAALLYAWWMQLRSVRAIDSRSDFYALRIAVEAAVVGQFVCGMFLGTLTYKYLWLTFMLALVVRNAYVTVNQITRARMASAMQPAVQAVCVNANIS